ncbi:MAG: enoyl-CoA hydratase/isomerase family protein [Bacteroidales bacterium]|nr:enoyl-CoA hydratase/isomerase family protein [Bacteroidales bacterium]
MKEIASNEFYNIDIQEELAILTIKKKVFDFITDVNLSNTLIDFIRQIDYNNEIKALIFLNARDSFTDENYDRFIREIIQKDEVSDKGTSPKFTNKNTRFREINMLNSIIKTIAGLQKLVICGLNGTVVTPFFGASLVADFRYASADAEFSMIHNKYGLHPSGGLPFFLSSYLHHSKALEIQMCDRIDVNTAYDLGLITKIVEVDQFEDHLIKEAKEFTGIKYGSLRDTKRLTNFYRQSLNKYFDFEAEMLNL